jgi:hypothetical protein
MVQHACNCIEMLPDCIKNWKIRLNVANAAITNIDLYCSNGHGLNWIEAEMLGAGSLWSYVESSMVQVIKANLDITSIQMCIQCSAKTV